MNKPLLDIFLSDPQNCDFIHNRNRIYEFLSDSTTFFDQYFYPYLERLKEEGHLQEIIEKLTPEQKEALVEIPNKLVSIQTVNVEIFTDDDNDEYALETNCLTRIVKSYKHPVFLELLDLILINKSSFSLKVDDSHSSNGYHFHLYEGKNKKLKRTATLLTFDKKESPCKKIEPDYTTFQHTLYYEYHSKGSEIDINSKNPEFIKELYSICKEVVINQKQKSDFKEPDQEAVKVHLVKK